MHPGTRFDVSNSPPVRYLSEAGSSGPAEADYQTAESARDQLNHIWYGYHNRQPQHYDSTRYYGVSGTGARSSSAGSKGRSTRELLQKLTLAWADGSYPKLLNVLAKAHLRILDGWLRNPLTEAQTQDLLEIIDGRYQRSSTVLASQIPVADRHERFAQPTLSDTKTYNETPASLRSDT